MESHVSRSVSQSSSPFGGIPRNWKLKSAPVKLRAFKTSAVPPSGGSLEIGNPRVYTEPINKEIEVPPSGGSLEIGNLTTGEHKAEHIVEFPHRGDP